MKFTKYTFLMLGLASVLSLGSVDADAYNDCTKFPDAGEYCFHRGEQYKCPEGCYCTGNTKTRIAHGHGTCDHPSNVCSKETLNPDCLSVYNAAHVFKCPVDFPKSPKGAKSEFECYNDTKFDHTIYRSTYYTCGAGEYLKAGYISCFPCTELDLKPNEYCPGIADGTAVYSSSKNQGIKTCASGYTPTADLKSCEKTPDPVLCSPGAYLPANSETCTPCLDGRVCPGALDENGNQTDPATKGGYVRKLDVDQGLYFPDEICKGEKQIVNRYKSGCDDCGTGYKANDAHTECIDAEIEVPAGKYLPANRVEPYNCTGAKKFCPGGKFWKKDFEQGRYDCPFNSTPKKINPTSAGFDGCDLNLTQEQMKNGISGNGECWKKTDPDDYRYCIYGMRFELPGKDEELDRYKDKSPVGGYNNK